MNPILPRAAAIAIIASLSIGARAATVTGSKTAINDANGFDSNPQFQQISGSDLLEAGSASLSGVSAPASDYAGTPVSGLNDGGHIDNGPSNFGASTYYAYNSDANGGAPKPNLIVGNTLAGAGAVVTFSLNLANSPLGYTIGTVNTFAGWQDHPSVADQNYTLSYSTFAAPSVFIPVATVAYNPFDPSNDPSSGAGPGYGSEVSVTNLGLVGVAALQFDFKADPASTGYGQSGTGIWLQEIDASAAPEPSTYAMMLLGAAGLLFVLRARRSNA